MKTQTVTIRDRTAATKTREVEAIVIGPLCVHRCIGTTATRSEFHNAKCWTLGHVATGFGIMPHVSKARALRLAEALQSLDWEFKSPKSPKVKAMEKEVLRIVEATK